MSYLCGMGDIDHPGGESVFVMRKYFFFKTILEKYVSNYKCKVKRDDKMKIILTISKYVGENMKWIETWSNHAKIQGNAGDYSFTISNKHKIRWEKQDNHKQALPYV